MVHILEINAIGTQTTMCGEDDTFQTPRFRIGKPIVDCRSCLELSGADDVIHYEHINNSKDAPISMCLKLVKRSTLIPMRNPSDGVSCEECINRLKLLGLLKDNALWEGKNG